MKFIPVAFKVGQVFRIQGDSKVPDTIKVNEVTDRIVYFDFVSADHSAPLLPGYGGAVGFFKGRWYIDLECLS